MSLFTGQMTKFISCLIVFKDRKPSMLTSQIYVYRSRVYKSNIYIGQMYIQVKYT